MVHRTKVKYLKTDRTREQVAKMIKEKGLAYSEELIATFNNGRLKDVNINYSPF